jgi:hypothetical protein
MGSGATGAAGAAEQQWRWWCATRPPPPPAPLIDPRWGSGATAVTSPAARTIRRGRPPPPPVLGHTHRSVIITLRGTAYRKRPPSVPYITFIQAFTPTLNPRSLFQEKTSCQVLVGM